MSKTREYERLRSKRRRAENGGKLNELARARHAERMATDPAYKATKAANALRWQKNNPIKVLANVVRRDAEKIQATPAWASQFAINEYYEIAAAMRMHGIECEVDHIVPLRSPRVCGLHVGVNLQVLSPYENKSKGNRHWPGSE